MYYKRFHQKYLDMAIAKETVTMEQIAHIIRFYEKDEFILHGIENVNKLKSVIPNVEEINYEPDKDLYFIKINEWPHLKEMCLKFAIRNPCKWIYVTETDDTILFHYHIDLYTIEFH